MTSIDGTAYASGLAELEAFLASGRVPLGFFNLSSLDGFLATVLVGPVWMPPEVWLPLVWNYSEPEWPTRTRRLGSAVPCSAVTTRWPASWRATPTATRRSSARCPTARWRPTIGRAASWTAQRCTRASGTP